MAGTGKLRQPSVGVTQWRPPGAYPLALEVMSLAQLRQRAPAEQFERTHRIEFYSLMVLTRGRGRHMIDFETIDARAGSWLR